MLRGGDGALLPGRRHEGAAGEVASPAEQAAGALVDRRHGIGTEEGLGAPRDREVVGQIVGHVVALEGLHVAPSDDARREGLGGVEEQLVDEVDLAREDDGDEGARVEVGLGDGVELVEDVEPEEMGFVDEEDGSLLLARDVHEEGSDEGDHLGDGVGGRRIPEGYADLPEKLHEGARSGDEGDDAILGRVKLVCGGAERGALAGADLAGDDGGKAVLDGIVEAV